MMKYKVYEAETLQQAILKMIMDLGQDAILINHRTVRKGGILGLFGKRVVEVTAAAPIIPKKNQETPPSTVVKEVEEKNINVLTNIQKEIQDIKSKVDDMITTQTENQQLQYQYKGILSEVYEKLIDSEVEKDIASDLIAKIIRESPPEFLEDKGYVYRRLEAHISKMIRIASPIDDVNTKDKNPKVAVFVGPTGVGKTTTLAKLATELSFVKSKKVAVITIDTYRVAAVEQMRAYCEILNLPMEVVFSLTNFEIILNKYSNHEFILVDTAGRSHKNIAQMAELKSYMDIIRITTPQIYLVLAANIKYKDILSIVNTFMKIPFHKIILTKVDESVKFGFILNLLVQIPQGISYITNGQDVPENIEEANTYTITRFILDSL